MLVYKFSISAFTAFQNTTHGVFILWRYCCLHLCVYVITHFFFVSLNWQRMCVVCLRQVNIWNNIQYSNKLCNITYRVFAHAAVSESVSYSKLVRICTTNTRISSHTNISTSCNLMCTCKWGLYWEYETESAERERERESIRL